MNMKMLDNRTINYAEKMRYKFDNDRRYDKPRMNKKKLTRYQGDADMMKEARECLGSWDGDRVA